MCENCINAISKEYEGDRCKEVYCGLYMVFLKAYSKCDKYELDDTLIEFEEV